MQLKEVRDLENLKPSAENKRLHVAAESSLLLNFGLAFIPSLLFVSLQLTHISEPGFAVWFLLIFFAVGFGLAVVLTKLVEQYDSIKTWARLSIFLAFMAFIFALSGGVLEFMYRRNEGTRFEYSNINSGQLLIVLSPVVYGFQTILFTWTCLKIRRLAYELKQKEHHLTYNSLV
jgi:uncharacterized membrane protein